MLLFSCRELVLFFLLQINLREANAQVKKGKVFHQLSLIWTVDGKAFYSDLTKSVGCCMRGLKPRVFSDLLQSDSSDQTAATHCSKCNTVFNNMCFLNITWQQPWTEWPSSDHYGWTVGSKEKKQYDERLTVGHGCTAILPQNVGHQYLLLSELRFSASGRPIFSPGGTPVIILISSEIHDSLSGLPKVGSWLHCTTKQGSLTC